MPLTKLGTAATTTLVLALLAFLLGDVASAQGARLVHLIRGFFFAGVGLFFVAGALILWARRRPTATATVAASPSSDATASQGPRVDVPLLLGALGLVAVFISMLLVVPFTPKNREPTIGIMNGTFLLGALFSLALVLRSLRPLRDRRVLAAITGPTAFWVLVGDSRG